MTVFYLQSYNLQYHSVVLLPLLRQHLEAEVTYKSDAIQYLR